MGHKLWLECDYCYEEFTPTKRGQTSCPRCLAMEEGIAPLFDSYDEAADEDDDD